MASIDPFVRKKAPIPVPPADQAKQSELLARATGRKPLPAPPPASPFPGITGNPPMPTGRVVGHTAPSNLTDVELATLGAMGWTPDIPLPTSHEGLKQLQQAVSDQTSVHVPLPVDPRTPALKVTTVPIDKLPPAQQASFRNAIAATIQNINIQEQQTKQSDQRSQQMMAREAAVPGVSGATNAADDAVEAFRKRMSAMTQQPLENVPTVVAANPAAIDAINLGNHFAKVTEAAQQAEPAPEPDPKPRVTKSETGADAMLTHCPHCRWDLSLPDIAEPPHGDKIAFIQCMVGDRPFVREYQLFGGTVNVTFRTLTTREIDIVYKQAYQDRQEGKLPNELDYWERVNRYRLMLQLQSFKSDGPGGFHKDLPDAYSSSTNPTGTGWWVTPEQEKGMTPGETAIPVIEDWMVSEVLKTEAVFRVVNNVCNQFNRLVAMMEAMADNTDFWKPTGEPS